MTYKNIFLGALLVPFAIFSNSDIDAHIQELKRAQHEKELKLSEIGKIILEKEEMIDSIRSKSISVYSLICALLNDQEKKEFMEEVEIFEEDLDKAFIAKEDLKQLFEQEFINRGKSNEDQIARVKSSIIRYKMEYNFLKGLFKNYEKCLEELIKINIELDSLQK